MALFKIFNKRKKPKIKRTVKKRVKVKKTVKIRRPEKIHIKPKVKKVVKPNKVKIPAPVSKKVEVKTTINKMPEEKAYELLKRYRIKIPEYAFCSNEKSLVEAVKRIGFPCVLKVSGKGIIHKTEVNGVRVNIRTLEEAVKTFNELMKIKGCEKVIIQKMITEGYEIIIGGKKDPQFNKVIALGAGGIFTEFLKDVSFRVSPLSREDAEDMLNEVKFSDLLLKGFRGQKPANKEAIINTILAVSNIMERDSKIKEIDINPLFANYENAFAVDVRIILE